ncbi:MAG: hypothetical protein KC619_25225 [Myxococcales bacterium]|nr:hypothetical protein [Myxococcales bacterium]
MMKFMLRMGSLGPIEVLFGYALDTSTFPSAVSLRGVVIAASHEIFFGEPGLSAYGRSMHEEYVMVATRSEGLALLRRWLALQTSTPRYTLTQTNCASVIVDMLWEVMPWRFRARPHRLGRDTRSLRELVYAPYALRGALREEFFDYSIEESFVSECCEHRYRTDRGGRWVRISLARRHQGIPAGVAPSMHGHYGELRRRRR